MTDKKTWIGKPPSMCNMCHGKITLVFIDGKTRLGPWADMCEKCHKKEGVGLGTGKGQRYQIQANGYFAKVEG